MLSARLDSRKTHDSPVLRTMFNRLIRNRLQANRSNYICKQEYNQAFPSHTRFFGKIGKQLEDLTYVEVLTMGCENSKLKLTPQTPEIDDAIKSVGEISVLARTKIELDGDIAVLLPLQNNEVKINNEIMDIHRENVKVAIDNWNNFMKTTLEAAKTIADIAGLKDVSKAFDSFVFKETAAAPEE